MRGEINPRTPWTVEARETSFRVGDAYSDDGWSHYIEGYDIFDGLGVPVVGPNGIPALETGEDRAAFIVLAVNSHDALVEALTGLLERYTSLVNCGDCGNWDPETEDDVIAARAALASVSHSTEGERK